MYEKIIEDEDGRTIHFYDDSDLCLRLIDEDSEGEIVTEIIYLHKGEDTKGWIEFKRGSFVRSYVVDESGKSKKVLVFDRNGKLTEESPYDD